MKDMTSYELTLDKLTSRQEPSEIKYSSSIEIPESKYDYDQFQPRALQAFRYGACHQGDLP